MTGSNYQPCFEAPEPVRLAPLFPGYTIECLIATGGMGAVYKAVQNSLDRPVAIKILPREFGEDAAFRANFEAEAKTMARLNHPNLVGVHDFGEVDGMLFIVMEFVPGNSLFHAAHGVAVAPGEAARLVIGVCQALAHAHEHGILHRDIKPGNILLDMQARPKIGDFGLARPIGASHKAGETIYGTPDYTAPEVIRHPNLVDARADIFSIGVVLHELLSGRLPAADPRPPSLISGCNPGFDAIVRRATHPAPDQRYASAAEMAKEISAVVSAATQPARLRAAAHAPGSPRRPAVRSVPGPSPGAGNAGGIAAIVAVAAAVVIALFLVFRNPAPAPAVAQTPTPVVTPEPAPPPPPAPESVPVETPAPPPKIVRSEPAPPPAPAPEVAKVEPAPVKPPPPVPTFDVPAFLDKARVITRQKAAPSLATHAKAMEKNFAAFERRVKREIRDLDKGTKAFVETKTEERLTGWRNDGNRLPKTLELPGAERWGGPGGPGGFGGFGGPGGPGWGRGRAGGFYDSLNTIHAEYLAKQNKIDDQLELDMLKLTDSTYVLGLKKQIERLTDPNEAPSVKLIEAEIDSVKASTKYFVALMRGVDPKAAAPVTSALNSGR